MENTQLLTKLGLTAEQAKVYEALIKGGIMPARLAASRAGLGRALAYKILGELEKLGLAEKTEKVGKIALFSAAHPGKLRQLAEERAAQAADLKNELENALGSLISAHNLNAGKPNVQFFEGLEGIMKVAEDSLSSQTEILAYVDSEAVNKLYPELNRQYVEKRTKRKVLKKIISVDSPFARQLAEKDDPAATERLVIGSQFGFATVMQIYDNKVSYINLRPDIKIGVIIEDQDIYKMHAALFEYNWQNATPLVSPQPAPPAGETA